MIIVPSWQDSDVIDKDVRSCDNKDIGHVREINQSYLVTNKGDGLLRVPRGAVGTFNDGKVYLRATEAEVLSGIYPFLGPENENKQTPNTPENTQRNVAVGPAVPQTT